ncbi:hypothetical protein MTO96_018750, partial [Rhipicephalus appendiculatus]
MDLEGCPLRKGPINEEETVERHTCHGINLYLVFLLAVGLGLICCLLFFGFIFSNQSQDESTMVDTLLPIYVPRATELGVTRPSQEHRLHGTNTSTTALPDRRHNLPTFRPVNNECAECPCRSLAQQIRAKLDYGVDPCEDFYAYVCNTFRGKDEFTHNRESIRVYAQLRLIIPLIPESNQLSWQKAAGMYHACLNLASSYEPETEYLVEWMKSLNLDLLNETILATINPVEMMVRGPLDLGIEVVVSISFADKDFKNNKRVVELYYSIEHIKWRDQKRGLQDYIKFLTMYGASPPLDKKLALKIRAYENELDSTERTTFSFGEDRVYIPIFELGQQTTPYVTSDEWGTFFSEYTNGTYGVYDLILYQPHVTRILVKLFKNERVGEEGLRYLVAWSIYRQLVEFTEPYMFLRGGAASDACYDHVSKVMHLALISSFFQSGSPGKRLDPEYVEAIYKPYPDAPLEVLFPTWIKALSLSSHYIWSDQITPLYDEAYHNSYFSYGYNSFEIPTVDLLRPLAYPFGPAALNYGGIGM